MSVTILGQHISLIRPRRIYKPVKLKQLYRDPKPSKPITIHLTITKMRSIAHKLGYKLIEL